jgi:ubiquinone/menaquinone biosynthesis C-methylase UbiE
MRIVTKILPMITVAMAPGCRTASSPTQAHHADHHGHHSGQLHPGGMVHAFKGADEWAKIFDDPARDAWQKPDEVVALMKIAPGMAVGDVGAGTGYFTGRLARAVGDNGSVVAVDTEVDMVNYVRARASRESWRGVEARVTTADDPSFAPASVDRILIVDVWHHVANRLPYAAKLAAALKPGGAVFVVDFTMDSPEGPSKEHRLLPEAIVPEFKSAGLIAEVANESLPYHYIVVARKAPQ